MNKKTIEKPIKRIESELPNHFVNYLYDTYEPQRNSAGEFFFNGMDYLTNEISYMQSATEIEFISEYGLAPIGFLEILRTYMAKSPQGFGLCINNKSLKKAFSSIEIDYDLKHDDICRYYDLLLEHHLIIIIDDVDGRKYATTVQQLFNWEYKMWTRWSNNEYQKKRRSKNKENDSTENQNTSNENTTSQPQAEAEPPKEVSAEDLFEDITSEEFFGS